MQLSHTGLSLVVAKGATGLSRAGRLVPSDGNRSVALTLRMGPGARPRPSAAHDLGKQKTSLIYHVITLQRGLQNAKFLLYFAG
jgi:hypothetical protein